jgi:hypothetical protein
MLIMSDDPTVPLSAYLSPLPEGFLIYRAVRCTEAAKHEELRPVQCTEAEI